MIHHKIVGLNNYFISKEGKKIYHLETAKGSKKRLRLDGETVEIHNYLCNTPFPAQLLSRILTVHSHFYP